MLSEYRHFAESTLGPLLLDFSHWVRAKCEENNVERVYFECPDVTLAFSAYQQCRGFWHGNHVRTGRLLISKSLAARTLGADPEHLETALASDHFEGPSCDLLEERFGFTRTEVLTLAPQNFAVSLPDDKEVILRKLLTAKDVLSARAKEQRELITRYLQSEHVTDAKSVAVVGLDPSSSAKKELEILAGRPITGLYFCGPENPKTEVDPQNVFWPDCHEKLSKSLLTILMRAGQSSPVRFRAWGDSVLPIFAFQPGLAGEEIDEITAGVYAYLAALADVVGDGGEAFLSDTPGRELVQYIKESKMFFLFTKQLLKTLSFSSS
jgi:hypothetical protein